MTTNFSNFFYHGVVFHLFHNKKEHKKAHGSLSADNFNEIIKTIGKKNILDAEIFYEKLLANKLKKNHVCFTFDDAHKSAIDIALPILEDLKIVYFLRLYKALYHPIHSDLDLQQHQRLLQWVSYLLQ